MPILRSLKNQKEFDIVNKHGRKLFGSCFIIILAKNFAPLSEITSNPTIFFGMKVSRKISKKAVVRNKIKRRIRHIIRNLTKISKLQDNNLALIIIPRKGFENSLFDKLNTEFQKIVLNSFF